MFFCVFSFIFFVFCIFLLLPSCIWHSFHLSLFPLPPFLLFVFAQCPHFPVLFPLSAFPISFNLPFRFCLMLPPFLLFICLPYSFFNAFCFLCFPFFFFCFFFFFPLFLFFLLSASFSILFFFYLYFLFFLSFLIFLSFISFFYFSFCLSCFLSFLLFLPYPSLFSLAFCFHSSSPFLFSSFRFRKAAGERTVNVDPIDYGKRENRFE